MVNNIFEIKIMAVDNMPEAVKKFMIRQVSQKPQEFQRNFKGFAKIIYITNSPKSIHSIEPIEGTIVDYFNAAQKEGVNIPVF
jgi:hypothetical protein